MKNRINVPTTWSVGTHIISDPNNKLELKLTKAVGQLALTLVIKRGSSECVHSDATRDRQSNLRVFDVACRSLRAAKASRVASVRMREI